MDLLWLREEALASVSVTFGTMSLLIGGLGLFALLDYNVGARKREWGVRMALGASSKRLLILVFRDGIVLALWGAAVGVPLALVAGQVARALLSGVSPHDLFTMQIAILALVAAVLIATAKPALRAARTQPSDALRAE